jgi:hypothetical protein
LALAPVTGSGGRYGEGQQRAITNNLHVCLVPAAMPSTVQIFGRDLVSCQNDGKGRTAITGKIASLSDYSSSCIDMRADEVLISA